MKNQKNTLTVTKIYWERVFLHMELTGDGQVPAELFLMDDNKNKIPLELSGADGRYHLMLNIACVKDRSFLENGRWYLAASMNQEAPVFCHVTSETAYQLDDLSRIFKYAENQMAYTISFGVFSEDEKTLSLYLDSYFMEENAKWKKRRYVKEVRGSKKKIKRAVMAAVVSLIRCYYHVMYRILPKNGRRILIMSETRGALWGNLKYIDDRMKERGLDKQFTISYSFRKAVGNSQSLKDSISWIKLVTKIAESDVIFVDDYSQIFGFFTPGEKTKLIQVWHAGEGFKSVGYSRFGKEGSPYPAGSCHKKYTHVITGSEHLVEVFQEVFAIEKEAFYPVGMPRLDGFLDERKIASFKERFYGQYPELKGKRIILFAPTYRGAEQKTAYYDYDKLDLKEIYQFCKERDSIFLIKMHPFVKDAFPVPEEYRECLVDFTDYPDINELYYITDVLITDYSSNYFEYALLKRPALFYTYDREMYELTRGVHRSVKENAPGKVCDTFEEMMEALKKEEFEMEKMEQFVKDNFGTYSGNASDRVIDEILLK